MRKWNNPYLRLDLAPSATQDEIRKRARSLRSQEAKEAERELTQDVAKIFPFFLTAVPGLFSIDEEVKNLWKRNRTSPKLTEDVLAAAFEQMGLKYEQQALGPDDLDLEKAIALIEQHIGIHRHAEELVAPGVESDTISDEKPIEDPAAAKIKVPQLIGG